MAELHEKKKWFMQAKKRDPQNKRDIRVQVSLSAKDKDKLRKSADEVELPLAEYMYWVLMNKTLHVKNIEFTETLRLIANESDNLNQLAFKLNLMGALSPIDKLKLNEIITRLDELIVMEVKHLKQDNI
jgi:hypothetical protein